MKTTYSLPILPLDDEFVLKHDQVPLAGAEAHVLLQLCTKSVKEVSSHDCGFLFGREDAHPSQPLDDALGLFFAGELCDFLNAAY
jgi:hypothetical protein